MGRQPKDQAEAAEWLRLSAIIGFSAQLMSALRSLGADNIQYAINAAEKAQREWPTERPADYAEVKEPLACQLRTLRILLDFHNQLAENEKLCHCDKVEVGVEFEAVHAVKSA